jgi:hypothetical protein
MVSFDVFLDLLVELVAVQPEEVVLLATKLTVNQKTVGVQYINSVEYF